MVASVAAVTEPKTLLQENRLLGRFFFVPLDVRPPLDAMCSPAARRDHLSQRRADVRIGSKQGRSRAPALSCIVHEREQRDPFSQGLLP